MSNPAFETVEAPFTSFRFEVAIELDEPMDGVNTPVCSAAFAECEGLEQTMEPKTVHPGGVNDRQIHLIGPVKTGQLTLRRGMTPNLELWSWFAGAARPGRVSTALATVTLWDADGTPKVAFRLDGCLPVRMRGPNFHAKDGLVAIEELGLAYSSLTVAPPGGGLSAGIGIGIGVGISAGASVGVSASAGVSFSAGASASAGFGIG
jgi:phage tail-like protein